MKPHRSTFSTFLELFTKMGDSGQGASPGWFATDPGAGNGLLTESTALAFDRRAFFWAMRNLPVAEACKHFLVCGTIGSGKTIAIRLFLQSIARRFRGRPKTPEQLVLFDAKGDAIPLLAAMGLRPTDNNVYILNPYDKRSKVWNIGEAVDSPAMARHLATLLVPEEPRSNSPYFSEAARELVYSVILALTHIHGKDWGLRDLLCALDSRDHIARVSAREPRAKILAERILHDDRHSDGVLSTLGTKLGRFEQVAALWHANHNTPPFSIPQFLKHPGVLILGNDPVLRSTFWPINAILLKALSQEILRGPETLQPRHWFVLDEFRAMERVDCIQELLNRGRSKGASVLLGIQSVEGLLDVYGDHAANDILGQCTYKTFLRLGDPRTARWAEDFIGRVRRVEPIRTESWSHDTHNESIQYSIHERSLLMASYFMNLPLPRLGGPHVAVSDVPWHNCIFITDRSFQEVLGWCRPPTKDAALVPFNDPAAQKLRPWTAAEELTFCGPQAQPSRGAKSPATPQGAVSKPTPQAPKPAALARKRRSWVFATGDFKDLSALVDKLEAQSDPVSAYLMSRFSAAGTQALRQYDAGTLDGRDLRRILVREFAAIILGPSIYEPQRFAKVKLAPETLSLLQPAAAPSSPEQLNRALLEDAYPRLLARRHKAPRT